MMIREIVIAKLQQLPDSLLQQVSDFIDFVTSKHKPNDMVADERKHTVAETWTQWFQSVDHLPIVTTEQASDYQQHLLAKYRKQGLEL